MRSIKSLWSDSDGATTIEYVILIAAISVPSLFSLNFFGKTLTDTFSTISTTMRPGP